MAEELGEKTEAATPRRRGEARTQGNIARSTDLYAAVDLVGGLILLVTLGPGMFYACGSLLRTLLGVGGPGMGAGEAWRPEHAVDTLLWTLTRVGWILGPFVGLMFAVVYLAQFMQVGWLFTTKPLELKLNRLDPVAGFGRLFGSRNAVKAGVNSLKMAVVGTVAVVLILKQYQAIAMLPRLELMVALRLVLKLVMDLTIWILALLLVIGVVDYAYQRWQYGKDLRMTKQEIKDERRSMEGDMETKARRLKMARVMMLQQAASAVPKADVVVTNPTHFAVALKYDAGTMDAPRVVAKGADYVAFRIREIAAANNIPIVEKPPLARALYANVEVGRSIPSTLYEAVAEVLAYVYRLKDRAA